jgi:hypothetical protein
MNMTGQCQVSFDLDIPEVDVWSVDDPAKLLDQQGSFEFSPIGSTCERTARITMLPTVFQRMSVLTDLVCYGLVKHPCDRSISSTITTYSSGPRDAVLKRCF